MFVVEHQVDGAWVLEHGEYFLQDVDAVATARRRHTKDEAPRRVVTWPGGTEVWTTAMPRTRRQKVA